ncbi:50S ribosomal protein l19 [Pseudohyphozyma bogoriensis]|nr:50S ribosomal protein l19 [Pseudohyphozyma bogoriensis]
MNRLTAPLRQLRTFSSSSASRSAPTPSAYPYSPVARLPPTTPSSPKLPTSLLRTLNLHLASPNQSPNARFLPLFSRRSPDRLLPGSILTVQSYSSPPTPQNPTPGLQSFSGVLIAIRRRHAGVDTSFRLRNVLGRTGVELSFKVLSPLVKDIKIVQRAETSSLGGKGKDKKERKAPALRAERRAKLYFVRDQPNRLTGVTGAVKKSREQEELAQKKLRR